MESKRDWFLQQLGIVQWVLRCPSILSQSPVTKDLSSEINLLIISQTLPESHNPLFCDVLRSLGLIPEQTYSLTLDQAAILPTDTKCNSWRLGVNEPISLIGAQLYSPALDDLSQDYRAKRTLWQQIYYHEQHFHTY